MGRLGKVASPALSGNANPRLMRHKLADTTFRSRPNTDSSQTASPPVGAAACGGGADSPAPPSPAAVSAPRSGRFRAPTPGPDSGIHQRQGKAIRKSYKCQTGAARPGCARAQRASLQAGPTRKAKRGFPAQAGPPGAAHRAPARPHTPPRTAPPERLHTSRPHPGRPPRAGDGFAAGRFIPERE
jgi:hypothetical protein